MCWLASFLQAISHEVGLIVSDPDPMLKKKKLDPNQARIQDLGEGGGEIFRNKTFYEI